MRLIINTPTIQLIRIEFLETMSGDDLPIAMIFLTFDFGVERYLNHANRKKVLGTNLHPTVGSTAHNLSKTGHPRPLNQYITARESFVSQHFSSNGRNESSHPPHRPLNRTNNSKNGKGPASTHCMCQHANFYFFILGFT